MKNFVCFLALFLLFPLSGLADRDSGQQVILKKKNVQGGHGGFIMADMPDAVYYDSDEMEIIIEADGVSQYYDVINIADATMLSDYLVNQVDLDEFQLKAADVNGDGIVGIADITAINDLI